MKLIEVNKIVYDFLKIIKILPGDFISVKYVLDGGVIGEITQCGSKAKIFNSEAAVKKYVNDFKKELIKNGIDEYFEYYTHRPLTKNTDFKNDRMTLKEKLN